MNNLATPQGKWRDGMYVCMYLDQGRIQTNFLLQTYTVQEHVAMVFSHYLLFNTIWVGTYDTLHFFNRQ